MKVLQLALRSAAVPPEVRTSPVQVVCREDGKVCAAPSAPLSPETLTALQRLGVCTTPALPAGTAIQAGCWLQIVPLERAPNAEHEFDKQTVMFRVDSPDSFATLAGEMLQLGNDRQSYRHLEDGSRQFTLLRVTDPPYYSLLRAIDGQAVRPGAEPRSSLAAYIEQAPRVWVQIGFRHPLADRIDPPAGQFVLLESPGAWRFVDEGPFHDLYQTLELRLPVRAQRCQESSLETRIDIQLRLVAGNPAGVAELWVLRDRAHEQVEQLVTRSDDELVERLAFAVIESADGPIVILRVRPSRQAPPVLVLNALACCTYLKLPNLFVPVGKRLNPPLRRDAVSKLLAADARQLTWLEPHEGGSFTPISVADSAFRPLSDWVEYIIDHQHQALDAWVESHRFDFESFVCHDDAANSSRTQPERREAVNAAKARDAAPMKPVSAPASKPTPDPRAEAFAGADPVAAADASEVNSKPNILAARLKAVEKSFLESQEAFDSPHRQAAWREMGLLNSHLKRRTDTTVCWCNGFWNEAAPEAPLLRDWLMGELRASELTRMDIAGVERIVADVDAGPKDATLLGAYLIHALATGKGVNDLRRRAGVLVQYFLKQERFLPIRAVWLIALALHQLTGGDTLGLARTRDRILERLFEHGLQGEFDIASFLRGDAGSNDRRRTMRSQLPALLTAIDRWIVEPVTSALGRNKAYARLIGAYGLAKIGEVTTARGLLQQAIEELGPDPIHRWMGRAFEYRIQQAANGMPDYGTLPDDMLRQLEQMERLARYKVDRLRQQSRILEPHERIDPYRRWHRRYRDELYQMLAELQDLRDREQLQKKLSQLLNQHRQGERAIRVMASALELVPRLGEEFGLKLLERAGGLLDQCDDAIEEALLLQRAIYVSAHFDQVDSARALVHRLDLALPAIVAEYLTMQPQYSPDHKERIDTVEALFLQSFRGLRKLGMRDWVATLYGHIADHIQTSRTANRRRTGKDVPEASVARRLRLMLCVASGWYYFGKEEKASEVVEQVRTVLLDGQLPTVDQRGLAVAYAHTVAQAPTDYALKRIQELFAVRASGGRALPKIEDAMTTSTHFSVAQMELIEASILALLSDDSGSSSVNQRWLDEDEFSIRKRIHADMKQALNHTLGHQAHP